HFCEDQPMGRSPTGHRARRVNRLPGKRTVVKPPVKVALLIETSNSYARGLLRGIVSYIREHRPWSLYLSEHTRGDRPPPWLAHWKGSGIIARIENSAIAAALSQVSVTVVDVSAARLIPSLPWFETDDVAIAHLA